MNHPIDVIVPVYRGLQDVIDCLDSVNASTNKVDFDLIVIDDCSPDPQVSELLKQRASTGEFTLLVNEQNLGFVATVNRGMQLHPERDVLLLNSDTIVANDWLDRIHKAAYASENIGTVTPFSNNATICSYPYFCKDNTIPNNTPLERLDLLCAVVNSEQSVEVPTGVGFCMYIRRACLDAVGYFDVETFGKGYGEENDFCQRAIKAGWQNRFALDAFIHHTGNVSFGDEHNELKHGALAKLVKRHPEYERDVHLHIAEDPAKEARVKLWLASLIAGTLPIVLHVTHNRGGGTLRFVEELANDLSNQAYSLMLLPSVKKPGYLALTIAKSSSDGSAPEESEYTLFFNAESQQQELKTVLQQLPIRNMHFHHLLGLPDWIMDLPRSGGYPWLVSLHDYYYLCQSISLTNEKDLFIGHLEAQNNSQWSNRFKAFIEGADLCIAPSNACLAFYQETFPKAHLSTVYHEQGKHLLNRAFSASPIQYPLERPLKVIIIGALSKIKGADLLEKVALQCAKQNVDVEFELIGYSYRDLASKPKSKLTVSGQYDDETLVALLKEKHANNEADLVWFTALWPETYSYTLSSAIEAGLPVVVPNIGAFSERVYGRENSWIVPWDMPAESFTALFKQLSTSSDLTELEFVESKMIEPASPSNIYQTDYFSLIQKGKPFSNDYSDVDKNNIDKWIKLVSRYNDDSVTVEQSLRKGTLKALYYLRSAPALRPVSRLIPLTLQRKIKNLLSH
ncbi:Glycosyltransferase, GT2 family [Marinomonas fungiae]|uniref:Glycosyltransferase, GT2 family n=2 Tax=Marinomonas fungiae TaxID=1137284 RepID=A0A0K6IHG7_9GAMM|nr:Glycosyltransferase, GT2 family [Marinomonas fungiae]